MFQSSCFNKIKELFCEMFLFWAALDKNVEFVFKCLVYLKTANIPVKLTKLFMDKFNKCFRFAFGKSYCSIKF